MFWAMMPWNTFNARVPQRLFEAPFNARFRRCVRAYLTTVDRVRGWVHRQLHGGERRAISAAVAERLSFGMARPVNRRLQPH